MLEGRKFPRLNETWDLDYRIITSEEFRAAPISSFTVNISGGGVCFEANEEISKGTILALELKSTAFSASIIALAKTTWCKKKGKNDKYDVGAEFWWIGWEDNDAQQSLAEYIIKKIHINI